MIPIVEVQHAWGCPGVARPLGHAKTLYAKWKSLQTFKIINHRFTYLLSIPSFFFRLSSNLDLFSLHFQNCHRTLSTISDFQDENKVSVVMVELECLLMNTAQAT